MCTTWIIQYTCAHEKDVYRVCDHWKIVESMDNEMDGMWNRAYQYNLGMCAQKSGEKTKPVDKKCERCVKMDKENKDSEDLKKKE
jgi:hypothetical protein